MFCPFFQLYPSNNGHIDKLRAGALGFVEGVGHKVGVISQNSLILSQF